MRFQPDTGAQCNVIPVELYKKATKDHNLERVEPITTPLVAYGGTRLNVVGHVKLLVERNNMKYKISDFPRADFTCVQNKVGGPGALPRKNFSF